MNDWGEGITGFLVVLLFGGCVGYGIYTGLNPDLDFNSKCDDAVEEKQKVQRLASKVKVTKEALFYTKKDGDWVEINKSKLVAYGDDDDDTDSQKLPIVAVGYKVYSFNYESGLRDFYSCRAKMTDGEVDESSIKVEPWTPDEESN